MLPAIIGYLISSEAEPTFEDLSSHTSRTAKSRQAGFASSRRD
jgi:hypothetical protein